MAIVNPPVAAAYVEAIEALQRVLSAEPAPPRGVIRVMDLSIAWMAACALTLEPTIKIHAVTASAKDPRWDRLWSIVANLAHPKDDHCENPLEDEAHDLIRELEESSRAGGFNAAP